MKAKLNITLLIPKVQIIFLFGGFSLISANVFFQNKILHNRLESMHVKLAELEHVSSSIGLKSASSETHGESDLQVVINYLRRSKEIVSYHIC